MCFNTSYAKNKEYWQTRFGADLGEEPKYKLTYFTNAAVHPECPVITNEEPEKIQMFEWGLIPFWARDREKAEQVRKGTINARNDTLFEKASFKHVIMKRRCLVLVDGFYEWRKEGKKKVPHHIRMKSGEGFAIAGIWDIWEKGESPKKTFSVITTEANPLLARIHNVKKRMPAILLKEHEKRWLVKDLKRGDIEEMLQPIDEELLDAFPVSKLASDPQADRNVSDVMKREKAEQSTLF
jgi:putative SOS response-associated peptidase YedK